MRSVRTPAALEYTFTAGEAHVPLPPGHHREEDPRRAGAGRQGLRARPAAPTPQLGVPTDRAGRAAPTPARVTSFCVVNVPFYGQGMEIPYTSAA